MSEEKMLTIIGNKLLHMKGVCPRSLANLSIESQLDKLNLSQNQYAVLINEIEEIFGVKFYSSSHSVANSTIGLLISSVKNGSENI